jgi:hypothetical protein
VADLQIGVPLFRRLLHMPVLPMDLGFLTDCFTRVAHLGMSSGGRGFSPGVQNRLNWALAPEVYFL